jgi:Hint domain
MVRPRLLVALAAVLLAAGCGGSSTSPGPSTSPAAPLGAAALKIRLLDMFGPLSYCDPDEYPVARADQDDLARQRLPEIRADAATWGAIATHLGIDPAAASLTGDQTLTVYQTWKQLNAIQLVPVGPGFTFDQAFGPDASGQATRVVGTMTSTGQIAVNLKTPAGRPACPICLALGTPIATPDGPVPVERIRPGMPVWTTDAAGHRIAGIVLHVGSTAVPPTHHVVHLVLADGREVTASPGHRLADGRAIGDLRVGDLVDGSAVVVADLEPYPGPATFDLVPSSETGFYWAGGILLASTIR